MPRHAQAWLGGACRGEARRGEAWLGLAGRGRARQDLAGRGRAGHGKGAARGNAARELIYR